MPTFSEFAWFFQHDYDLGQLRRVRSASASMSPWFKLVCAGEYGQVALGAHDVQEHTWPMLLDLLRWISDETRHDVLIVSEYELFDEKLPVERMRLRYVHARSELVLENNPHHDEE